jgi:alpha-tubulin suppressor-like RCC1 family protein
MAHTASFQTSLLDQSFHLAATRMANSHMKAFRVFPSTVDAFDQIACGSECVFALIKSRDAIPASQICGWGWNEHGNLGLRNMGQGTSLGLSFDMNASRGVLAQGT